MELNQIENWIDPITVESGRTYRENAHILSITEIKPLVYYAEVVGSELYDVKIKLNSTGEVSSAICECSYDKGPICKHAAAVLFQIRDDIFSKVKPQSASKNNAIADQLSKLSKDELITLLITLSNDIDEVEQALCLKFIDANNNGKKPTRAI